MDSPPACRHRVLLNDSSGLPLAPRAPASGHAQGFMIRTKHSHNSYWHDLASSIFCVAAAGWAWGGRMKVAVTRGCIPVIVQVGLSTGRKAWG